MKLLNADKLIEWIENNKEVEYDNFGKKVSCEINDDDLLSFISTNSIEVEQIKPKGIVEINDEIMEREYENYLDAIYIHKADVKASNNSHNIEKELNVGKSCKNCETHYQNEYGNPNPNTPCEADDDEYSIGFCKHWTPKADKVKGEI